jgi:hypothetical protein
MCDICCKEKRGVRLSLCAIDIARENLSSCKHLMDIVTGLRYISSFCLAILASAIQSESVLVHSHRMERYAARTDMARKEDD